MIKNENLKLLLKYEEYIVYVNKMIIASPKCCRLSIGDELKKGIYNFGEFREFYVYDPKKRRILAAPFEDRIVHTWYVKEFIEKIFVPMFISSSYACIMLIIW